MRIGTLFSGIGAPEQGAMRVYDIKHTFACECDKFARQSFLANYDIDEAHFHKDIYDMDGAQYLGKVDVLVGGSPCQAFSVAGLRKGLNDKRGELIYEYIRIVDEVKAPIIVYENVKGMLSIDKGRTIKAFVQALRDIGYHCHYSVLNSKDYGVPQNRERLFLVGFLDVEHYHAFSFAPKVKLMKRLRDVLESEVDEKYYINRPLLDYDSQANTLHDTEKEAPTICAGTHGYAFGYIQDGVVGMLDMSGHDCIRRVYGIDGLSPTIPTGAGGNHEPKIQNKDRIRKLTPRECLRLQDFPDTFKQVVSDSQMYKQAGNSMTVAVLEMIFIQIVKAKNGESNGLFGISAGVT